MVNNFGNSNQKEDMTFQYCVLIHINRILDLTKEEFYGGGQKTSLVNGVQTSERVSDKREEYCQTVEAFSDILAGHYMNKEKEKEPMKQDYEDYESKINELEKTYYNDDLSIKDKSKYDSFSKKRLKITRNLFRNLMIFYTKKRYLKGEMTGDD